MPYSAAFPGAGKTRMGGFFTLERKQVLCATETEAVFANVRSGKMGRDHVEVLSHQEKKPDIGLDVALLIAGTGRQKAKVALVLPLKEFQLVAVTAPPVAREAVAKVLPYSLAKQLSSAVTDYVYDWQVAQKFKDRHELTVYLFPAVRFHQYRNELEARKKEIIWFEPDVFAACAYLHFNHSGVVALPFLCLLVWPRSLSIAVYENGRITLVRSVEMAMPEGKPLPRAMAVEPENFGSTANDGALTHDVPGEKIRMGNKDFVEEFWLENGEPSRSDGAESLPGPVPGHLFVEDAQGLDVLAGFGLQADAATVPPQVLAPDQEQSDLQFEPLAAHVDPWPGYLESINLEILRTGDYHVSVLKGSPIREVFIGGAEHFHEALAKIVQTGQNIEMTSFPPKEIEAKCSQVVAAICIGALQR
jgi:hypothetical protein